MTYLHRWQIRKLMVHRIGTAVVRDALLTEDEASAVNNRVTRSRLQSYVRDNLIPNAPAVIHGADGPVLWKDLRRHPKVRARNGRRVAA